METWILVSVAVLVVGAVCVTAMIQVSRTSRAAIASNARTLSDGFDKLLVERHWNASNSIEARLADKLGQAVDTLAEANDAVTDKVMAFTTEGRDLMALRGRMKVLQEELSIRTQAQLAVMRAAGINPTEVAPPEREHVTERPGATSVRFDNEDAHDGV